MTDASKIDREKWTKRAIAYFESVVIAYAEAKQLVCDLRALPLPETEYEPVSLQEDSSETLLHLPVATLDHAASKVDDTVHAEIMRLMARMEEDIREDFDALKANAWGTRLDHFAAEFRNIRDPQKLACRARREVFCDTLDGLEEFRGYMRKNDAEKEDGNTSSLPSLRAYAISDAFTNSARLTTLRTCEMAIEALGALLYWDTKAPNPVQTVINEYKAWENACLEGRYDGSYLPGFAYDDFPAREGMTPEPQPKSRPSRVKQEPISPSSQLLN